MKLLKLYTASKKQIETTYEQSVLVDPEVVETLVFVSLYTKSIFEESDMINSVISQQFDETPVILIYLRILLIYLRKLF